MTMPSAAADRASTAALWTPDMTGSAASSQAQPIATPAALPPASSVGPSSPVSSGSPVSSDPPVSTGSPVSSDSFVSSGSPEHAPSTTSTPSTTPHLPEHAPAPWLCGPRVQLREFCADDLPALMRMHADPRLRAHLLDDQPLDQAMTAWQFLVGISRVYRAHEGLGIWHASSGDRFIGWFNLMPLPARGAGAVELGSRLLPDAWGGALALEGGELLLAHAFGTLGLPTVWATCDPRNRSARGCLAALGFCEDGVHEYDGHDALYACIDADHWRAWMAQPRRERVRAGRRDRERVVRLIRLDGQMKSEHEASTALGLSTQHEIPAVDAHPIELRGSAPLPTSEDHGR